jgi:hypothetical protein
MWSPLAPDRLHPYLPVHGRPSSCSALAATLRLTIDLGQRCNGCAVTAAVSAPLVLLAVIFVLAPSALWLLAMFATCVTLAQAGWLPPSFLRGPWAPPARCPCHEHGDRGEQCRTTVE